MDYSQESTLEIGPDLKRLVPQGGRCSEALLWQPLQWGMAAA